MLINARPTISASGPYEKIAAMKEEAERRFPGAVWSFSIGWGCDKLITAVDPPGRGIRTGRSGVRSAISVA